MHQKCLAAGLLPDAAGSAGEGGGRLSSLRSPSRSVGQGREHTLCPQLGALSGEEGWNYVEGAEMNDKGFLKLRHRHR